MNQKARLFSIGYQLRSLEEIVSHLTLAGVNTLLDVRETPWSRKPGLSKKRLAEALGEAGIEYVHLKFVGNPKELRRAASDYAAALSAYDDHLEPIPPSFLSSTKSSSIWRIRGSPRVFSATSVTLLTVIGLFCLIVGAIALLFRQKFSIWVLMVRLDLRIEK